MNSPRPQYGAAAFVQILVFHLLFLPVSGQDPTPSPPRTPSSAEARANALFEELERRKRIAELERDIARASKETAESLPAGKATPPTGELTTSAEDIGQDIIVYRQLGKAVVRISDSIRRAIPANATVVILESSEMDDWTFYRRTFPLFRIVVNDLTADYCLIANSQEADQTKINTTGVAGMFAGAGNLIGQFADLLAYFRTTTLLSGRAVNVNEDAVVAALFSDMRQHSDLTLLYPKAFAVDSPVFCQGTASKRPCCMSNAAANCMDPRPVYCSDVARLLDELYTARRAAFAAKNASPELKKLEKYFEEFIKLFAEATPASADTVIRKYVNAEHFDALHKRDNVYFLEVKSVRAVGTQRVRKNLFFLTDKLDYSGGVIVQWTLFDRSGNVRQSGIETAYDGFLKPERLRDVR